MNRIGIIVNRDKDVHLEYTGKLVNSIIKRNGKVNLAEDAAKALNLNIEKMDEAYVLNNSDMIICLGGDGTLLGTARKAYKRDIPILGINLGSLGFLTEVDKNDIDNAVEKLFNKQYEIEERMVLEATVLDESNNIIANDIALNDITISRTALSRILSLKMYINGSFVDSFVGDGLIIASPTGSTAYSMSAGGPIVEPDMNLMILTSICSHLLYSRPYITKADNMVKVVVEKGSFKNAVVSFDGQKGFEASGDYSIEISRSSGKVKLLRITSRNFFNVLRTKIYDRGESLRKDEV